MIDTLVDTQKFLTKDVKFSDWLADQPANKFCKGTVRTPDGEMCALGFYADFLGAPWSEFVEGCYSEAYIYESMISNITYRWLTRVAGISSQKQGVIAVDFDHMFRTNGPQAAKEWAVEMFRDIGL